MTREGSPKWPFVPGGGKPRAEVSGRNIVLIGFFFLLCLIAFIGYLSGESFKSVENEIATLHQAEAQRLKLVLRIAQTAGEIAPEARVTFATTKESLLHFPSEQRLGQLKDEMESLVKEGHAGSIASTREWADFESSVQDYWKAIDNQDPPSPDWEARRQRLSQSIASLEDLTQRDRDEVDRRSQQLSKTARDKVGVATVVALAVGVLVAGLAFYESHRILNRLDRAYRTSAESRDYLQSLLNSLVSGVLVIGADRRVITTNNSFPRLTGFAAEDAIGRSYEFIFSQKTVLLSAVSERLECKGQYDRYCCRAELANRRLFDVFASPLVIGGEQRGLILVFVDITDVERAQIELRRNRALTAVGQMTAQIAHEIKNPLGSIRFAAEVLRRRLPADDGKDHDVIDVIERSVDHLAAVVTELCEFTRPKELNRCEINLNELLDDLLPMVADRLNEKEVTIDRVYSSTLPVGRFDGSELRKLFLNLIINAIDASEPGDSIKLQTRLHDAGVITVDVVDQGSGMDRETQRRLFEPFYTTKQKGTGLGMSIAKKIAELHCGDLVVASTEGKGTTITVRLPTNLNGDLNKTDN